MDEEQTMNNIKAIQVLVRLEPWSQVLGKHAGSSELLIVLL